MKPDCFFPTIAGELQTLDDEFFCSLESAGIPVFSNAASISKSHCDKFITYQIMRSQGVPFAQSSLLSEDRDFTEHSESLVLKPRFGSGGRGVFSLSKQALNACHKQVFSDYLIQDDLSVHREEFTLGVYCPPNSSLTLSCLLLRTLKSGRTWTIRRIVNPKIESCASTVTRQSGALYLNFQGFLGANDFAFFEVNPRLSGSVYFQSPVVNAPAHWVTTKVLGKNLELESFVGEYSGRRIISEEISLYSPTRQ
jgi:carbamoylphosphate synthase large subunit